MTSPSFNYFYRVELQVAQYELGGIKSGSTNVRDVITRTYNFVNKPIRDAATASVRETYIPILQSVGEITLSAGDVLPSTSLSAITLDDSRGSFGPDRRFSDLLERSTIIGQAFSIYIGESDTETDAPVAWIKIGGGKVTSWSKSISTDAPTITIQVEPFKISDRLMSIEISRDISGMEDAPDESIGKNVPVVFNGISPYIRLIERSIIFPGQQVAAIRITTSSVDSVKYAIATHLFRTTMSAPLDYIFVKKDWNIESTPDVIGIGVPIYFFVRDTLDLTSSISGTYTINQYAASAYKIPEWSGGGVKRTTGVVVTSVDISMKGQGSSGRTSNGYLSVFILRVDPVTYNVIEEMARGRVSLNNYNASNNLLNNDFIVRVSFDRPVILEGANYGESDFYIGFEASGIAAGDMVINRYIDNAPYQRLIKQRTADAGDSYSDWKISPDSGGSIAYKLNLVEVSYNRHEDIFTPDGLTYSSLTLSQTPADVGQVNPSLDSLSVICLVNGLCRYAYDGGITGGTSSAYTATTSLPWTSYVDGWSVECIAHADNAAGATLSVDGLAAWPIYENGSPIAINRFATGSVFAPFPVGAFTVDVANSRFNYTRYGNYEYGLKVYETHKALELLSYEWDGEKWEDKDSFDVTTLNTSHYEPLFTIGSTNHRTRMLGGSIDGKSTYLQVLSSVATGTASKIGAYSNGKIFIFPWGVTNSIAYIIPQADIIPLSWETRDESSIINRVQLSFEKNYIDTEGAESGLKFSVDFSNPSFTPVSVITERSRSIYGIKNILDNSLTAFGFAAVNFFQVGDAIGMPGYITGDDGLYAFGNGLDFLADYYISRFALPFVYCSFVVPYHRYKDIKMFDVISFYHSEFPAHFGTDPAARSGVVDDGTSITTVQNANYGEELVRAKTYRGLVEAVSYVMAMEHAPAIRLTVQVLINTEYDPT